MKEPISFACPAYNDAPRLHRLLESASHLDRVNEIFVINHRSDDDTQSLLQQKAPELARKGINLRWIVEQRDFSQSFTMADLRAATIKHCSNEVVYVTDSDHVLGPGFSRMIDQAFDLLREGDTYAVGHELLSIIGNVEFDQTGRVLSHADCYLHVSIPRFVLRDQVTCRQDVESGRYYWCHPKTPEMSKWVTIDCTADSIIAVDDRCYDRQQLRRTMNNFFVRSVGGELHDTWHEAYDRGALLDDINEMDFFHESNQIDTDLTGERFWLTSLNQ